MVGLFLLYFSDSHESPTLGPVVGGSMKIGFILLTLISFSSQAANICDFEETSEFHAELRESKITSHKTSSNSKRFTFIEKDMIHLTMTLQESYNWFSAQDSLVEFSHGGEISYYQIDGKEYALVHYWPGDNEYGAFFELKGRSRAYRLVAEIHDSSIYCR
jgi:hypothetical protein